MATVETNNARIFLKNGKEINWNKVNDFIPGKGEMIVYNPDEYYSYPRLKVGNGKDLPKDLPFVPTGSVPGFDPDNIVAKRVEHMLTFGAGEAYQFDGSSDVTVPVYTGKYNS